MNNRQSSSSPATPVAKPFPLPRLYSDYSAQLEPEGVVSHFLTSPPEGFQAFLSEKGVPGFFAKFDLLTTADAQTRRCFAAFPGAAILRRWLNLRTCFFGTTVSEYAPFPAAVDPSHLPQHLLEAWSKQTALMIAKDIPSASDLLSWQDNLHANIFLDACRSLGFIIVEGQGLAYVPIDFADEDEYLSRLSPGRRKDIRRKLRVRHQVDIETLKTGTERLLDESFILELYSLYLQVYQQSEIHFDRLTLDFLRAVVQDPQLNGRIFLYYAEGQLIGYNLCFIHRQMLIDKYVGFRYPEARRYNLYFISWMENLTFARSHGLSNYVAGWTDPEIKAYLGARFTFTRHAVYVRNRCLRAILRRISGKFENDRAWFEQKYASTPRS